MQPAVDTSFSSPYHAVAPELLTGTYSHILDKTVCQVPDVEVCSGSHCVYFGLDGLSFALCVQDVNVGPLPHFQSRSLKPS